MRLLLFDIDGTLVHCGGQARPFFADALVEVYGRTGAIDDYDFSGKTDPRIVVDLMTGAGLERAEVMRGLSRMRDAYLDRLEAGIDPERVEVLPGVVELLNALAGRTDCALGLLTGNWERGAGIKLRSAKLDHFFAFGSFGDDCTDRRDLPPAALARAAAHHGREFAVKESWIVGDSLLDVDCARAHGIPCLAVATGRTRPEALAAAGAHEVLPDLAATATAVELLLGARTPLAAI